MVTGSLIRSPNITSDSPLTEVTRAEVTLEGTTTIENLINSLPQAIGGQNLGQSIDSTGTSNVSLRGLGAQRTLVLVDGRRMNPGDPSQQAPGADLNMIPTQMVERVDIVTGGASATYGADAVAGVVNFVMRKNFQGVEFDVQASANENDQQNKGLDSFLTQSGYSYPKGTQFDGEQYTASVIMGTNSQDGKGNVTAFASYFHSDPVLQTQRDYSSCALGSTGSGATHGLPASKTSVYDSYLCIGSSNSAYGRFTPQSPNSSGELHDNPNGTNTFVTTGVPGYNFNALSYLQREDDRYNIGYFAHYEISPQVELYSDFMFLRDNTTAQFGPSGLFAGSTNVPHVATWQINCNNPLMSAQQQLALCGSTYAGTSQIENVEIGYRAIGAGPRSGNFTHDNFRVVVGARGDINDAWSYDSYLQYGHVDYEQGMDGYLSLNKVQNGLLVNPNGTCYVGGSCVPFNIFEANSAGITKAQLAYLSAPGYQTGNVTEQIADFTVNGDLGKYSLKSPFATDGVSVAAGVQYRRENLVFTPDYENQIGDLAGNSVITPTSGSFDVYELFTEAHIPIVQNLPFAKAITFNPGYRFSDYSSIGNTNTYKLDGDWAVTSDLRLRYSYNVAIRAPNITELYTPDALLLYAASDPCAGSKPQATLAQCEAQGVTAAQYGTISNCPASQCSTLSGGNPNLQPETAKTYTYGAVLTPRFLPRFLLSVDYYNIRIENTISAGLGGAAGEVAGCIGGQAYFCSFIHRDPLTGELYGAGYVTATDVNEGFIQTKGIDVDASYSYPLPRFGRLSFSLTGTYTLHTVTEPYGPLPGGVPASGTYDCAGYYGVTCGVPTPAWRHKLRVTWNTPLGLEVSAQWRYVGGTKVDVNSNNPLLQAYGASFDQYIGATIGSVSYLDLSAQYKFRGRYTFRVGINNVLDKLPPVGDANNTGVFGAGNGNTFPQLYDTLGRNMYVGVTADF